MNGSRERIERVLLSIWWGGLTFYAVIVVPAGTSVLGSTTQGFVTQRVTFWLNALCLATLVATAPFPRKSLRKRSHQAAWLVLATSLPAVAWTHHSLSAMLNPDDLTITATDHIFYRRHQIYLWLTAIQWLAGMFLLLARTRADRSADAPVDETSAV